MDRAKLILGDPVRATEVVQLRAPRLVVRVVLEVAKYAIDFVLRENTIHAFLSAVTPKKFRAWERERPPAPNLAEPGNFMTPGGVSTDIHV
jgi:hypothetical protein